ncbi:SGNH/GDSL hydrolase family protein [Streptomyces sp. NA04227]|uniref:SGNH/GDSL hydrolase family protein n=1 Tax=Streptomyces sp. NA04227 TaxID=2742136 RepID=UPI0015900721|nr:SGNH/GDSL hydrolase family protein [Streptomyces sp. NA04227]QKW09125.1 SGNH/GDSL hydrolase family protein [Streptomyces sp. NA04227]
MPSRPFTSRSTTTAAPRARRGARPLVTAVAGCAALLCTALGAAPAQAQASADAAPDYVALGDSFAAAPLVPAIDLSRPACLASKAGYPDVAAERIGARLNDVSCSGATLDHFASRQFGFVAPQYEALGPGTDLVSLTIGGNDNGLVTAALSCLNALPEPVGASCADRFTSGGRDQLAEDIADWAPRLGEALDEIHRRAPAARVFVVGYGDYIRKGGCYPTQPIWARDADYVQGTVNKLSAALREQAAAHNAVFVDGFAATEGHDSCAAPGDRHLEGLIPTSPAAPLHPSGKGSAALGTALAEAIRADGATPGNPAG